jgi:hypothetical protein
MKTFASTRIRSKTTTTTTTTSMEEDDDDDDEEEEMEENNESTRQAHGRCAFTGGVVAGWLSLGQKQQHQQQRS